MAQMPAYNRVRRRARSRSRAFRRRTMAGTKTRHDRRRTVNREARLESATRPPGLQVLHRRYRSRAGRSSRPAEGCGHSRDRGGPARSGGTGRLDRSPSRSGGEADRAPAARQLDEPWAARVFVLSPTFASRPGRARTSAVVALHTLTIRELGEVLARCATHEQVVITTSVTASRKGFSTSKRPFRTSIMAERRRWRSSEHRSGQLCQRRRLPGDDQADETYITNEEIARGTVMEHMAKVPPRHATDRMAYRSESLDGA